MTRYQVGPPGKNASRGRWLVAGLLMVASGGIAGLLAVSSDRSGAIYFIPALAAILATLNLFVRRSETAAVHHDQSVESSRLAASQLEHSLRKLRSVDVYQLTKVHDSVMENVPYVRRSIDDEASKALKQHGALLLRGEAKSGKSRLVAEAVNDLYPEHKAVSIQALEMGLRNIDFSVIGAATFSRTLVVALPHNEVVIDERSALILSNLRGVLEPAPVVIATISTDRKSVFGTRAGVPVEEVIPFSLQMPREWPPELLIPLRTELSDSDFAIAVREGLPSMLTGHAGAVLQVDLLMREDSLGLAACQLVNDWSVVTKGSPLPNGAAAGLLAMLTGQSVQNASEAFDRVTAAEGTASPLMSRVTQRLGLPILSTDFGYAISPFAMVPLMRALNVGQISRLVWVSAIQVYNFDAYVLDEIGTNAADLELWDIATVALIRSAREGGRASSLHKLSDTLSAQGKHEEAKRISAAAYTHGATSTHGIPPILPDFELEPDEPDELSIPGKRRADALFARLKDARDERSLTVMLMLAAFYESRGETGRAEELLVRADLVRTSRQDEVRSNVDWQGLSGEHGLEWFLEGVFGADTTPRQGEDAPGGDGKPSRESPGGDRAP